ncbi:hypothetical protein MTO96_047177, partial [Rhipicephalus appendiculatus]
DLRAALTGCLTTPGEPCQKNKKRPTYSKKTLETLVEIKGCNSNEGSPSVQGAELPPAGKHFVVSIIKNTGVLEAHES